MKDDKSLIFIAIAILVWQIIEKDNVVRYQNFALILLLIDLAVKVFYGMKWVKVYNFNSIQKKVLSNYFFTYEIWKESDKIHRWIWIHRNPSWFVTGLGLIFLVFGLMLSNVWISVVFGFITLAGLAMLVRYFFQPPGRRYEHTIS